MWLLLDSIARQPRELPALGVDVDDAVPGIDGHHPRGDRVEHRAQQRRVERSAGERVGDHREES